MDAPSLTGFGCTFNQVFGFFQAKASDGANFFNDVDFLVTNGSKNHVKFVFLFSSFATATASSRPLQRQQEQQQKRPIFLQAV